jgi:hypothetical protein
MCVLAAQRDVQILNIIQGSLLSPSLSSGEHKVEEKRENP